MHRLRSRRDRATSTGLALATIALAIVASSRLRAADPPAPPGAPAAPAEPAEPAAGETEEDATHGSDVDKPAHRHERTHPPAAPKTGALRVPITIKDGMARIEGTKFTMGSSDRSAPPNERPARIVVVPSFWIDRTEVTVAAYRACVEASGCARPKRSSADCTYDAGDPRLPVSCVTWRMASAFCRSIGKRLPREAEWELAARGHTPIRYPWGGAVASCGYAVTLLSDGTQKSCGRRGPSPVGAHPSGASPYGVLDMSGNVEEWVSDWYAESGRDLSPRAGSSHALRGGGWLSKPSRARTTSRSWGSSLEAGPNVGFRCARDG